MLLFLKKKKKILLSTVLIVAFSIVDLSSNILVVDTFLGLWTYYDPEYWNFMLFFIIFSLFFSI